MPHLRNSWMIDHDHEAPAIVHCFLQAVFELLAARVDMLQLKHLLYPSGIFRFAMSGTAHEPLDAYHTCVRK